MSSKRQKWTGHYKSDSAKQRAQFLDKKVRYLRKITTLYNNTFVFRKEQTVKVPLEKPIFYGLRYRCVLKDNYADRFPGMKEAVDVCGMWILFSGNEPRVCNLKSKNFMYDSPTSTIAGHKCWENSWFFYPNKWYRKGNLRLIPIEQSEYEKLSPEAQVYFVSRREAFDWRGFPVTRYYCTVPERYTKNICEKMYTVNKVIDDSNRRSTHDWVCNHTNDCADLYWYWGQNDSRSRWDRTWHRVCRRKERYSAKEVLKQGIEEYYDFRADSAEEW